MGLVAGLPQFLAEWQPSRDLQGDLQRLASRLSSQIHNISSQTKVAS